MNPDEEPVELVTAEECAAGEVEMSETAEPPPSEEKAVIDVHAPHGGVHTWKDFWIHLGTITLGLLIAVSLEQSVEWVHHLHQRHQLEEDLNVEAERNHVVVLGDLENGVVRRARLVELRDEVDRMRDSGGKLKLAFIPEHAEGAPDPKTGRPVPLQIIPSNAAWVTAKESGMVGLLPRSEAEVYSRLEVQHDRLMETVRGLLEAQHAARAYETRFEMGDARVPDLGRMSVTQLDEYSTVLSQGVTAIDDLAYRLKNFDVESEIILHGARSEAEMMRQVAARLPRN